MTHPAMFDALTDFVDQIESDLIDPRNESKPGIGVTYLEQIKAFIDVIKQRDDTSDEQKILATRHYILKTYLSVLANEGVRTSRLRRKLEEMMNAKWLLNMKEEYKEYKVDFQTNLSHLAPDPARKNYEIRKKYENLLDEIKEKLLKPNVEPNVEPDIIEYELPPQKVRKKSSSKNANTTTTTTTTTSSTDDKIPINNIVVYGDSLSDRGTMYHRKLFNLIPMDGLSGLKDRTLFGRFTDRYVWLDSLGVSIVEDLINQELNRNTVVFRQGITLDEAINHKHKSYTHSYLLIDSDPAEVTENRSNNLVLSKDDPESLVMPSDDEDNPEDVLVVNTPEEDIKTTKIKTLYYIDENNQPKEIAKLRDPQDNEIIDEIMEMMGERKSHYLSTEEKKKIENILGKQLKERPGLQQADIDQAKKDNNKRIFKRAYRDCFSLDNDRQILFKGRRLISSFCEGGLTAHDWSGDFSNLLAIGPRQIVATLAEKREASRRQDLASGISLEDKSKRLTITWAGANDLVTVNTRPSYEAAHIAIQAIEHHILQLIKTGDRNFLFCNLPDLSLTPRFQNLEGEEGKKERENAQKVTEYYNNLLQEMVEKFRIKHGNKCKFDVFNVHREFGEIYKNVESGAFKDDPNHPLRDLDENKINQPYSDSEVFRNRKDSDDAEQAALDAAREYMFDDDLHPMSHVHENLSTRLNTFIKEQAFGTGVNFRQPASRATTTEEELVNAFLERYQKEQNESGNSIFTMNANFEFISSLTKITEDNRHDAKRIYKENLELIVNHAFDEKKKGFGKNRTRKILEELRWLTFSGKANRRYPLVVNIMKSRAKSDKDIKLPSISNNNSGP